GLGGGGRLLVVAAGERFVDLLRTLVAEEQAAGDEQVGQRLRQELTQDHRDRQDDQQFVADRAERDLADDGQFAIRGEPVDVAGGDGGVVDDDARRLDAGLARRRADIVDRRRRRFREQRD